jgi:hypothetical protein
MTVEKRFGMSSDLIKFFIYGRKYWINQPFQMKFLTTLLLVIGANISFIYLSNYLFIQNFIEEGKTLGLPPGHELYQLLQYQQQVLSKFFIVLSLSVSMSVGLWGLFFSHKICGPLFRLTREFEEAAAEKRNIKEIRFREDDFFHELETSINRYVDARQDVKPQDVRRVS